MKVKQLRLINGCHALAFSDNIMAGSDTTIELIGGGNFLVNHKGKLVFIPNGQAQFAVCEPDEKKK